MQNVLFLLDIFYVLNNLIVMGFRVYYKKWNN